MVERPTGVPLNGRASEQPDRVERVVATIETHDKTRTIIFEMDKSDNTLKEHLDLKFQDKSLKLVEGRLTNILKKNYNKFSKLLNSNLKSNLN